MARVGWLLRFAWPRSTLAPRATLLSWIALATVSIGSAWWSVYRFTASTDYWWVRSWLDVWQFGAHNPYHVAEMPMDYPPWALLVLTPLSWLPGPRADLTFLAINTAIGVLGAWQVVRWTAELTGTKLGRTEATTLAAMLLATRTMRQALILGQTMPVAMLFFIIALRLAPKRPWLSGVCFALASFKLNLAVGFGLVLLVLGEQPALIGGVALTTGLFVATAAIFRESPLALAFDYARRLQQVYGGAAFTRDDTGIRSLLAAFVSNQALVLWSSVAFAAGSFAALVLAVRAASKRSTNAAIIAYAVFIWVMLLLPNQSYNVTLVLPALWLILWPETRLIRSRWLQWTCASAGLVYFIPSVPFAIEQHVTTWWHSALGGALDSFWPHRARLVVSSLFVLLLARSWRPERPVPAR